MVISIDSDSTIAAISTPAGPGGIGIIKISGSVALQIAGSIFQRGRFDKEGAKKNKKNTPPSFESHKLLWEILSTLKMDE